MLLICRGSGSRTRSQAQSLTITGAGRHYCNSQLQLSLPLLYAHDTPTATIAPVTGRNYDYATKRLKGNLAWQTVTPTIQRNGTLEICKIHWRSKFLRLTATELRRNFNSNLLPAYIHWVSKLASSLPIQISSANRIAAETKNFFFI